MSVVEQNMWFPEVVAKWEAVVVERLQVEEEALVVESSDVQVNLSAAATTNSPRRAPFLPSLRQALVETATCRANNHHANRMCSPNFCSIRTTFALPRRLIQ